MKFAVISLVAILLLGGGAAGAYFYFGQKAVASVGETAEHTQAGDKIKDKKHGKESHAFYVDMQPLLLPIIDKTGVSQVISLVIVLQVGDEKEKTLVTSQVPRLTDAYIQDMYGVLSRELALKEGVLQVGLVKDRLNAVSNKLMGEGVVDDVLLQVVQQRQM